MPGYGARYWADRTADNRRRSHPRIKGAHQAEAVVIGGGLTGATAAYVLASGGLDVILVEAAEIAAGSTAGSAGIIAPEPDAWVRSVEPEAGRFSSRTSWTEAQKASGDFARALRKLDIKCDLKDAPYFINARSSEEKPRAANRFTSASQLSGANPMPKRSIVSSLNPRSAR